MKRTKLRNRGAFKQDFYVLRWSNMPALLVEGAFITNAKDARVLRSAAGRRRIAWGIADGVAQWFATRSTAPLYPRTTAPNGIALAAASSAVDFPAGAQAAIVVRAADAQTVLAASPLAASLGAPLLLAGTETTPATGPNATDAALARLRPKRLILAGTSSAFSDAWIARLAQSASLPTSTVEVVSGADIYELTANLARSGNAASNGVALARAGDSDAVAQAAQNAAVARMPLLLVPGPSLGGAATAYLSARRPAVTSVVVFGSGAAIPDAALAGLPGVRRVTGADRFQVAAAELYGNYPGRPAGSLRPIVVNAADPIAQAIANVRAARSGQPVVRVSGQVMSPWTREWITNNRVPIAGFQLIDQTGSLPLLIEWMLAKAECP